jgi:hypothetical protein
VSNNLYSVSFGREIEYSAGRKLETLSAIVAGQAMYLIDQIASSPIRDDAEKCAKYVLQQKPVSKQAIAVALFLLKTVREDELEKSSISKYTKPYIESVLKVLYRK